MPTRILCISNGHGEDAHTSHIIRALRDLEPRCELAAVPIVGDGLAYRRAGVPVVSPTRTLPSGGFAYMHPRMWIEDVRAGLVGLIWRQFRTVRREASRFDVVLATGDQISQGMAWASGRPFVSFISSLSAMYEGTLGLNAILRRAFASPRCRAVFTRDRATAVDLVGQGIAKARFGGIPSLDFLAPSGRPLPLGEGMPVICLLPGSRMPEAHRNLRLLLDAVERIARAAGPDAVQFVAALVPSLIAELPAVVAGSAWTLDGDWLVAAHETAAGPAVLCRSDAYADLLHASRVVLGMAGLAVDEAVALGKAVILIPGQGPQHTYRFAESQSRLLGVSARLVGSGGPAGSDDLDDAAREAVALLRDPARLSDLARAGCERLGGLGASRRIAEAVLAAARETMADTTGR